MWAELLVGGAASHRYRGGDSGSLCGGDSCLEARRDRACVRHPLNLADFWIFNLPHRSRIRSAAIKSRAEKRVSHAKYPPPFLAGVWSSDSQRGPHEEGLCDHERLHAHVRTLRAHISPARPRAAMRSPAALPIEIIRSAQRGELQRVVKWLRKGGADAVGSFPTDVGDRGPTAALLHAAAANGHLEMVRVLLKQGASVDFQTSLGTTALVDAAYHGHLSILLVLLQHSANPDLQSNSGRTALMWAACQGQEACVQELLRAKANTELVDEDGRTALQHAYRSLGKDVRDGMQSDICKTLVWCGGALVVFGVDGVVFDAVLASWMPAAFWDVHFPMLVKCIVFCILLPLFNVMVTVVYGVVRRTFTSLPAISAAMAEISAAMLAAIGCFMPLTGYMMGLGLCTMGLGLYTMSLTGHLVAGVSQELVAHTAIVELIRQHAASPQSAVAASPQAMQAEQAARVDAAMAELLTEEVAEQAKGQPPSKKSKRKEKTGRAAAADGETSEAPLAAAAAAPEPTVSAAERAEAALRVAITGGAGRPALEVALAAAPRDVREGSVGVEVRARCNRLLEQQEAEREAKHAEAAAAELNARQEATAVEAARKRRRWKRRADAIGLAAAEQVRKAAAQQEAVRMAIVSKTRAAAEAAAAAAAAEEAAAAAADRWRLLSTAIAAAAADALEQTAAAGSEVGSSEAAGPSEASEAVEVPHDYVCPITAEIMTDPVCAADGFTYERTAISEWLRTKDTSPFTGAVLENKTVIPNLSLRSMIRNFTEALAAAAVAAPSPPSV